MKTIKLLALLAAVLSFAACEKNNDTVRHERDIEYMEYTADRWTPDYSRSTNTVHLTTEGEFDTLLGRFCDDAQEGYKVALRNAYRNAKGAKEASSYSSDNRQDMKAWMRQKVDEGNTVTVYYDSQNSLWHGSADITALHPGTCYTGTLVFIESGSYNPRDPSYWGLKVSKDSTFRLVKGGCFITTNRTFKINGKPCHLGDTVTLCGELHTGWDSYNDYFYLLLDRTGEQDPSRPIPLYEGSKNGYNILMTLDENHHLMYCTSTFGDQTWQGKIGGGKFRYEETDQTDSLGNPVIMVYNDAMGTQAPFSMEQRNSTTLVLRDLTAIDTTDPTSHTLGEITLHRTYYVYETWVCDTLGFNIVIHYYTEHIIKYEDSHGWSSSPFYVNCATPFEAGAFDANMWDYFIYSATNNRVDFNTEYIYDIDEHGHDEIILTPVNTPAGCLESYVFRNIY